MNILTVKFNLNYETYKKYIGKVSSIRYNL